MKLVGLIGDWKILNTGKYTCDHGIKKHAIHAKSPDDCKKAAESSGSRYFFFQTKEQKENSNKSVCQIHKSCNLNRKATMPGTVYYNPIHEGNKESENLIFLYLTGNINAVLCHIV